MHIQTHSGLKPITLYPRSSVQVWTQHERNKCCCCIFPSRFPVILIIGAITAVIPFVTRLLLNVESRYHTCDASWYDRFHIVDRSKLKSVIVVLYIIAAPQLVAVIMSLLLDAKVSFCNYSSDRRMPPRTDAAAALLLVVTPHTCII